MRLSACLNVRLDVIGPTGFTMNDKALRRAGMDYRDKALTHVHKDFDEFLAAQAPNPPRLVLMTTRSNQPFTDFRFTHRDTILMGRETSGAPDWLHERVDARLVIPMMQQTRSLNMAIAAGLVLGEALRQTNSFPSVPPSTASTTGDPAQ